VSEIKAPILRDLPAELTGERVVVRPFRAGDGAALYEAIQESLEHIKPWLPFGPSHKCPDDSEEYVRSAAARWITRKDMPAAVFDIATGRFLGATGLHRIDWETPSFEIGYWLRKTAVGHGYMTEAVWLLCEVCFTTLGAQRVEIYAGTGNTASAAVARRLGFECEGVMRNTKRITTGELIDMYIFSMIPQEFERLRLERQPHAAHAHP